MNTAQTTSPNHGTHGSDEQPGKKKEMPWKLILGAVGVVLIFVILSMLNSCSNSQGKHSQRVQESTATQGTTEVTQVAPMPQTRPSTFSLVPEPNVVPGEEWMPLTAPAAGSEWSMSAKILPGRQIFRLPETGYKVQCMNMQGKWQDDACESGIAERYQAIGANPITMQVRTAPI